MLGGVRFESDLHRRNPGIPAVASTAFNIARNEPSSASRRSVPTSINADSGRPLFRRSSMLFSKGTVSSAIGCGVVVLNHLIRPSPSPPRGAEEHQELGVQTRMFSFQTSSRTAQSWLPWFP